MSKQLAQFPQRLLKLRQTYQTNLGLLSPSGISIELKANYYRECVLVHMSTSMVSMELVII